MSGSSSWAEQHPFPVALVRGYQQHRLALREQLLRLLEVHDPHPQADLGGRECGTLHELGQHLREAEAVAAPHGAHVLLGEIGEGLGDTRLDHSGPVGNDAIREPAGEAGDAVESRERHTRE
jgi:hypothetical protein